MSAQGEWQWALVYSCIVKGGQPDLVSVLQPSRAGQVVTLLGQVETDVPGEKVQWTSKI